jgi:hypothetical protein
MFLVVWLNKDVREGCCALGVRSGGNVMNYVGFKCVLCGNVNKGVREGVGGADRCGQARTLRR